VGSKSNGAPPPRSRDGVDVAAEILQILVRSPDCCLP
jgi:hypothetical protein